MKPKSFTVDATAGGNSYSPAYTIDTYNNPCNIGMSVVVSGSVGYTVQHTFTDPRTNNLNDLTANQSTWINHQYLINQTTTSAGNYAFPPSAIRLLVSGGTTGQAIFNIIQGGPA